MFKRLILAVCTLCLTQTACAEQPKDFKIFREMDATNAPANIAVGPDGRIFMSTHLAYGPPHKIVEVMPDGSFEPYPKAAFFPEINAVLGAIVDRDGIFWFLDTIWGKDGMGRVIGWDTKNEKLFKIFHIPRPLIYDNFILNDMAVDRDHNAIYIAETASDTTSAILVLDIETGLVRRVLEGSKVTTPEDTQMIIRGKPLTMQGNDAKVGINPITIDDQNEYVYFAPMTSTALYRVKTADLLDQTLDNAALEARVERYADKPMSDGITIDSADNVYISDIANSALGVITPDRKYTQLFQDDNVLDWVEGFANAGPAGIYATANKLHRSPAFNNEQPTPNQFYIIQFEPLAPATLGR